MTIFDFDDYQNFLNERLKSLPKAGRGEKSRMARLLGISSVAMGHIFNGQNSMDLDQAHTLAQDFGMSDVEEEYFFMLVNIERAKGVKLKKHLQGKLEEIRNKAKNLKKRVGKHDEVPNEALSVYYSDWLYGAIRLITTIEELRSLEEIANYLEVTRARAGKIINFLLEHGLLVEKDGEYRMGIRSTHLPKESPYINSHRRNWRLKGLEKLKETEDNDIFYSCPMTMSESGLEWLREEVSKLITKCSKRLPKEKAEVPVVLNIDVFKF